MYISDVECDANPQVVGEHPSNLANFWINLPGGYRRFLDFDFEPVPRLSILRKYLQPRLPCDKTPRELGESCASSTHSAKYLNESIRTFFASIDGAIAQTGVDREKVVFLNTLALRRKADLGQIGQQNAKLVLPAYFHLRNLGYTHYDLTR